ncbi:unnamed protein product [Amoebophrya sp. A25]|nr:unnamed protein product [Amoebophrya sp. A25]CAD7942850.1 unnamed protein product [Amoebophrya sp. A25]|eukprot:GSA25T00008882001.1
MQTDHLCLFYEKLVFYFLLPGTPTHVNGQPSSRMPRALQLGTIE